MTKELTLHLPDHIYRRAKRIADITGQDVSEIIARRIDLTLPPLTSELDSRPVESLPDEELLEVADSMMDEVQNAWMSALQYKQQAGTITDEEKAELKILLEIFEAGQLRKTQALVEAVNRRLRKPLS